MRRIPSLRVLAFSLRQRLARLFGLGRAGQESLSRNSALSPSARHFADYDTAPAKLRFSTGAWSGIESWEKSAREKLADLTGYSRDSVVPKIIGDDSFALPDGLVRRRVYLSVRTGVVVPVHLIAATTSSGPRAAMICLQGTNTGAHLSWSEARFPADVDKNAQGYDFAVQAARRGYLAVAIEQSCFGERAEQQISPRSAEPCVDATMHALLLGRSLLGERCYDVSRVCDWLIAQAKELDILPDQVHIMGHSAGGSVALFAAALDKRIGAVLACGCIGYIRETIGRRRDSQGQNVVPGILNWFELADVVGLIAPRPFVTVAGDSDHIWPSSGAKAVVEEARRIYALCGAAECIACETAPGGHMFRPELSWRTFEKTLNKTSRSQ